MYNCTFNESTAISANTTCFDALEGIQTHIKAQILNFSVAHFDETGMRVAGKLHWFHTASTTLFTYLFVHAKPGKEALQSPYSLLNDFKIGRCIVNQLMLLPCEPLKSNSVSITFFSAQIVTE